MPDAGSSETGKPDRDQRHAQLPRDWHSAFAALPMEAPDADGWGRVQARLPPAMRTRWPLWLAMAASLALAVAIPLHMQPGAIQIATADIAPSPGSNVAVARGVNRGNDAIAGHVASAVGMPPAALPVASASQTQLAGRRATPAHRAATPPSQRPVRTLAPPEGDTRIAVADSGAALESLYAQSAQLEDLLALARDDRVSSGPVAALTEDLDAQVASIDAALIQPDLPSQRRTELWGERVDTLRQLVGVEATQRLLAARGQPYDAALVSID